MLEINRSILDTDDDVREILSSPRRDARRGVGSTERLRRGLVVSDVLSDNITSDGRDFTHSESTRTRKLDDRDGLLLSDIGELSGDLDSNVIRGDHLDLGVLLERMRQVSVVDRLETLGQVGVVVGRTNEDDWSRRRGQGCKHILQEIGLENIASTRVVLSTTRRKEDELLAAGSLFDAGLQPLEIVLHLRSRVGREGRRRDEDKGTIDTIKGVADAVLIKVQRSSNLGGLRRSTAVDKRGTLVLEVQSISRIDIGNNGTNVMALSEKLESSSFSDVAGGAHDSEGTRRR